jgi:hypothetical protein
LIIAPFAGGEDRRLSLRTFIDPLNFPNQIKAFFLRLSSRPCWQATAWIETRYEQDPCHVSWQTESVSLMRVLHRMELRWGNDTSRYKWVKVTVAPFR